MGCHGIFLKGLPSLKIQHKVFMMINRDLINKQYMICFLWELHSGNSTQMWKIAHLYMNYLLTMAFFSRRCQIARGRYRDGRSILNHRPLLRCKWIAHSLVILLLAWPLEINNYCIIAFRFLPMPPQHVWERDVLPCSTGKRIMFKDVLPI